MVNSSSAFNSGSIKKQQQLNFLQCCKAMPYIEIAGIMSVSYMFIMFVNYLDVYDFNICL